MLTASTSSIETPGLVHESKKQLKYIWKRLAQKCKLKACNNPECYLYFAQNAKRNNEGCEINFANCDKYQTPIKSLFLFTKLRFGLIGIDFHPRDDFSVTTSKNVKRGASRVPGTNRSGSEGSSFSSSWRPESISLSELSVQTFAMLLIYRFGQAPLWECFFLTVDTIAELEALPSTKLISATGRIFNLERL